jgi:DtxR family manganese transport transcriptional regulator
MAKRARPTLRGAWASPIRPPVRPSARLKREGLARAKPYRGVFLTEAGAAMAKSARERHRLVVDLLIAVGAPREAAEADAEGIEHYVSASTLRAFETFLRSRGEP